ncbi:MAG: hypothetical protein PUD87_02505 [Prevotellaceae bacterium]|nr:hypothetical protein [Prevotellaceae bacterium]
MKEIEVEDLLKRFMAGETSVEEETALAEYFFGAGDEDRPNNIPKEDWEAYREMFRMFDDGNIGVRVTHPHITEAGRGRDAHAPRGIRIDRKPSGLRIYMAAAAVAAFIVLVFMLNIGGEQGKPMIAEVEAVDTIKAMNVPIDTLRDKPSIDKLRDGNVEISPTPTQKAKPKKQQKLPYTPPVPRHLIAQVAEANGISEDSMAVALEEAERLINAMTVYQELRISEICNVEYEEVY